MLNLISIQYIYFEEIEMQLAEHKEKILTELTCFQSSKKLDQIFQLYYNTQLIQNITYTGNSF